VDFSIGTAAADEPRIAEMVLPVRPSDLPPPGAGALPDYAIDLHQQAIAAVNTPQFRRAELPAANGHANARSLARIYGVLACGGADGRTRIVDADVVAQLSIESASGYDAILSRDVRRSLGFNLATLGGRANYGPNPRTFGHGGAGGSLGFADPDARIGFGYTMNQMRLDPASDPRWSRLIDALYASL
jgi:CubicO group peptidase (beta-lactamase class C family)